MVTWRDFEALTELSSIRTSHYHQLRAPKGQIRMQISLGLEGSANKLGVGIIAHPDHGPAQVLSNIRHTYITPPGEGFQPNHTAKHHKAHITRLIKQAMSESALSSKDLTCISYVSIFFHSSRVLDDRTDTDQARHKVQAWAHLYNQ